MIKAIMLCIFIPFYLGFGLVILAITLWMNVFTIPFLLLSLLFCGLIGATKPRPHFYGLMLYPTWSKTPATLTKTIEWWSKRSVARSNAKMRKQFNVTRPWEARFFD